MKIEICSTAGLCGGASRAVNLVKENLKNGKVCVYKQILHNENLIKSLENQGAKFCDTLSELDKTATIVLRAHGEEKSVYKYLQEQNIDYIDGICPNVKVVKDTAIAMQNAGYKIIVVGTNKNGKLHDETQSLLSYLVAPVVISDLNQTSLIPLNFDKYFLVCQTTFNKNLFEKIKQEIAEYLQKNGKEFNFRNTICGFPLKNIENSINLAKKCDIAVVYGSQNSSNTKELYMAVKDITYTIFSIDKNEIIASIKDYLKTQNKSPDNVTVAILAGASTLKEDLQDLYNELISL